LQACSIYLNEDIKRLKPKAILGLGSIPLSRAAPPGGSLHISEIRGLKFPACFGKHVCWYYPTYHPSFLAHNGSEEASAWPVFKSDIKKFTNGVDDWGEPVIYDFKESDVIQAKTREEVMDAIGMMAGPIGLDLETTGLKPYKDNNRVLCASASDGAITVAWPCYHPEAPNDWGWELCLWIAQRRQWIAHNCNFELMWLWSSLPGWDPSTCNFIDSMALGRLHQEREKMLSLEDMSILYLGVNLKAYYNVDRANCVGYPLSTLLPYCGFDSKASALIQRQLHPIVAGRNLDRLHSTIISITRMELDGIPINQRLAKTQYDHFIGLAKGIEAESKDLYEVRSWESTHGTTFELSNNFHVGEALVTYGKCNLPKNSKGYETNEKALALYAEGNPLAKHVEDHREVMKLANTYCLPVVNGRLLGMDGHIHPNYTCMHVSTGRLSSNDPNAQNYPERKHREIRGQLEAPDGMIIMSVDEGQLEARVEAMASKDQAFCQSIIDQVDIHTKWRDTILKIYPGYLDSIVIRSGETDEKALLKSARSFTKNDFVFALFFGSSLGSVSPRMSLPPDVAQELYEMFWKTYPGVQNWIREKRLEYKNTGTSRTLTGRIRSGVLPGNEPINNPIQGTAADIVLDAQNALMRRALAEKDPYLRPRWNVHDELDFFIPDTDDAYDYYSKIVAEELVKVRYPFQIVPLAAEISVGYNWADLSEVEVVTGKYAR
jgi:DNA polymerase I-like protein with 3'-5' exonuclease and polymerase domains